jgi:hypothetical protein
MPSARNARAVAAARSSQRCMRTASPRRDGRGSAGFRRPSDGKHEGSRIVHPMIPDLAAAARWLAAARRTHPHIYRSDRTPSPVCACAARREGPSHADIEMALRCRPRTPATPQLGGEAAPIQIIVCEGETEWLRRGETAASLPDSDGRPMATRSVTNRQSDDPGPCRRCAAALSCSADAPTCIMLGSHAKSGPRLRRSPQTAVPCGRRNGATLSPTEAPEPTAWRRGSAYPDHRLQGWNRVALPRRDGGIPAGFRRPSDGKHEESKIVHPMIPDLAAAARWLAAAEQMRRHKYRSDRTPGPVCACAARREGPSHADIEMALRCRPWTPATPQLGGEAAPIQIIA